MKSWKKMMAVIILAIFLLPQFSLAQTNISGSSSGGFCLGGLCLNTNASYNSGGGGAGWSAGNLGGFGLPSGSIYNIIRNILSWLLAIFGFLGIIGFVISGIMYVIAAGNDGMIEKAKSAMMWSIVGIVVGLLGYVIIQAVSIALQGNGTF